MISAKLDCYFLCLWYSSSYIDYRVYSCISRPFTTKKSAQKIALDLYTRHTQRPDQAVQEISITTAWSALGKFTKHNILCQQKKCEIINVKWSKCKSTGEDFYCVFWSVEQTFLLELRCCLRRWIFVFIKRIL